MMDMMIVFFAGSVAGFLTSLILLMAIVEIELIRHNRRERYHGGNVVNFLRYKEGKDKLSRISKSFSDNEPA